MTKIKPGDRVRVARELYPDISLTNDPAVQEGTVVGVVTSPSTWVWADFDGVAAIFHPDELEVIEP